jgi:hypothetical protein
MHRASKKMYRLVKPQLLKSWPRPLLLIRLQHAGPHKEYFQNLDQMPLPESGTHASKSPAAPDFLHKTSASRRLLNTAGLGLWSLLVGFGAGSTLITWAYLQGPFAAGSEEENDMLEEITEMLNDHPSMDVLLNDAEWEELPVAPRMLSGDAGKGLSFVTGTLTGSKGIVQVVHSLEALSCSY